jgi:hypothetical protein
MKAFLSILVFNQKTMPRHKFLMKLGKKSFEESWKIVFHLNSVGCDWRSMYLKELWKNEGSRSNDAA